MDDKKRPLALHYQKPIPYTHHYIDQKDIVEVTSVLKSDWITQGPKIREFEQKLANYVGTKYAVVFSSGTAALHGACAACKIGPGDEVIVPTLSFVASANCVLYMGATPILVDIDSDWLTIDIKAVEKKVGRNTRAIIGVDFAGLPAKWNLLRRIADKNKLILIDDASHALGSKLKNKRIGSIADLTVFSFHPAKIITTGEGGAVTTSNKIFYERLLRFRHHGILKNEKLNKKYGAWYYEVQDVGYNFRITDFQAALGISQLTKIDKFIKTRRRIWQKYNHAFSRIDELILPREQNGCFCAWHIYPIRLNDRAKKSRRQVFDFLRKAGIGVQVHYIPIHLFNLYKHKFGYKRGDFPVTEKYYDSALTLPLFPALKLAQQDYVIRKVKEVLK